MTLGVGFKKLKKVDFVLYFLSARMVKLTLQGSKNKNEIDLTGGRFDKLNNDTMGQV